MGTSSLVAAKQQLRALMKQRLADLTQESITRQSRVIFDSLVNFEPYVESRRLAVFLSMPSGEVQTDAIVRHALAAGKRVFVPYLHRYASASAAVPATIPPAVPPRVMDMVELRNLADYESLRPDRWGIPSIDPATAHERERILNGGPDVAHRPDRATLDLILVPGVAFDVNPETGRVRRCGHGRGFYDFFIQRYTSGLRPARSAETALPRSPPCCTD